MTSLLDTDAARAATIRLGDLTVNRMGFGAMRLCGAFVWGRRRRRSNERRVLLRALDLGVNFIDTAARAARAESGSSASPRVTARRRRRSRLRGCSPGHP